MVDLNTLEAALKSKSYLDGHVPSQADVAVFKETKGLPDPAKYPHSYRWAKHISTWSDEFAGLPGDPSKSASTYLPAVAAAAAATKEAPAEDEDDIDLFGSDDEEEDAEAVRVREERLAEYNKKKAGKVKPAAKSVVTLEVKPWDDETDMKALEANLRAIVQDGLVWGNSKLVPIGYGIRKLQITVVVEDEKVSLDALQEQIEGDEDHVQSTDIAAMQKL